MDTLDKGQSTVAADAKVSQLNSSQGSRVFLCGIFIHLLISSITVYMTKKGILGITHPK
jgi:hypothetical protein